MGMKIITSIYIYIYSTSITFKVKINYNLKHLKKIERLSMSEIGSIFFRTYFSTQFYVDLSDGYEDNCFWRSSIQINLNKEL